MEEKTESTMNRKQRRTEAAIIKRSTFQAKLKKIRDSKDADGEKRRDTIRARHAENKVRSAMRKQANRR